MIVNAFNFYKVNCLMIFNEVAIIGFIERTWMVSEGAGEVVLLLKSDGMNVEPVEVTSHSKMDQKQLKVF